jgi:outer membrane receptor protein involved in Fe transport
VRPFAALLSRIVALALAGATAGLLLPAAPAWAGTTGKIAGRVVDAKGQPLVGVSVAVPALRTGAATDAEGRYTILNVPAGTYDVRVNLLGYAPFTTTGLVVSSDLTAKLDVTLRESAVQLTEVVVKSTRPVVDVSKTTSIANVTAAEIAKLPVQELQDVVNLQAGVVDGHFRGGRLGEVQYQVDGVSVNNAYDNRSTLRLDRSLLEEVQVISGTFDAEYGQAQSGVVNAVLKRGGDRFAWNAETFAGGFIYPGHGAQRALSDFELRPAAIQNYQVGISGPTPIARTTYLLSARRYKFDDFVYGERRFEPEGPIAGLDGFNPIRFGDQAVVPLGLTREWSGVFKVSSRVLSNMELTYQGIVNVIDARRSDWAFRFIPDGRNRQHTYSIVHGLDLNRTLNKSSFFNFSVRQNYFDYRDLAFENLYDARYDTAGGPQSSPGYEDGAYVAGIDLNRFTQNTNTLLLKGSFVRQSSTVSQLKAGGEFQLPRVSFGTPGHLLFFPNEQGVNTLERRVDDPPTFPGERIYFPVLASAFAQNQIEHDDMTIRAGLRFDLFNARSTVPSDLANPANDLAGQPLSTPQSTTVKHALSPRLGVSWPTGPKAAAHFAYGHFSQFPSLNDIFRNADYSILKGLQADPTQEARKGVLGNPDIKPERTVQYEAGYKQAVSANLGVDLTVFYKDIRDLLGVEFVEMYNGAQYAHLTNIDFGGVLGFTLAFDLRPSGPFAMTLDYTWQNARGNSSDPRETQTRAAAGEDPRPRQIPFNWDQRHTVNVTASVSKPSNYTLAAIVKAGSGQPYTPSITGGFGSGLEANTGRKPSFLIVDLRAEKSLPLGGMPMSLFARVFNLMDTRFANGSVYATTGSPYYSRFPETDRAELNNPTRYYAPRRIEVGLNLAGGKGGNP